MGDISDKEVMIPNAQIRDMYDRFMAFLIANGELPNKVYLDKSRIGDYVTGKKFLDMLNRLIDYEDGPSVWIVKPSGTAPSPTPTPAPVFDGIYREQSHTSLDQEDAYSCGSHTAQNILSTWGISISDADARKYCKTGTHGTNPDDLVAGVLRKLRESGYVCHCEIYNSSDLKPTLDAQMAEVGRLISNKDIAVACLVNTGGSGWKKHYKGAYEHWVHPVEVNTNKRTITINDPARSYDLVMSYEEFISGVKLVSRKSWYIFITGY